MGGDGPRYGQRLSAEELALIRMRVPLIGFKRLAAQMQRPGNTVRNAGYRMGVHSPCSHAELTVEQLEFIKLQLPVIGTAAVAREIDQSYSSVRHAGRRMGIRSRPPGNQMAITAKELEMIRAHYCIDGPSVVAAALGRCDWTVRAHAKRLGLTYKCPEAWPQWRKDYLRQHWLTHSGGQIGKVIGKTRQAVCAQARRLGLAEKKKDTLVARRIYDRKFRRGDREQRHREHIKRQARKFLAWRRRQQQRDNQGSEQLWQ